MSSKVVKVTLTGPDEHGSYTAESDFPKVIGESMDPDCALHFARGASLHAIADWKHVPDTITFETVEKKQKETR